VGGLTQVPAGSVSADDPCRSILADNPPASDTLGLYVHVPFCAQRCHFCSFNTAPFDAGALARYLRALARELDLLAELPWAPRVRLATVFLGGGTPSLLEPEDLATVLDRVQRRFDLAPDAEVTIECNPESVSREKVAAYRGAGVTRVSLGVQSLDDAVLPRLGRVHDSRGARAAFEAAREAGCVNLSVDLMYGLPGLDVAGWSAAVECSTGRPTTSPRTASPSTAGACGERPASPGCRPRRRSSRSTGTSRARRGRAASSTTKSRTTRARASARATTRSTGAPPSTWPPARARAATSEACATRTRRRRRAGATRSRRARQ
jgi:hypothetical protein